MREPRFIPYLPLTPSLPRKAPQPIGTPGDPGYLQLGRWWDNLQPGHGCARGWVRDERFARAGDIVIKGTNRAAQRRRK
jgi:hypothetical protein